MIIQCKIAIYFNAEAQGRRVRRGSWSLELELESGGLGVRGQESGVRSWSSELELESGVGERSWRRSGVRFWHLMQSPGCAV